MALTSEELRRARFTRYNRSAKRHACQARYQQTDKGKEVSARYESSFARKVSRMEQDRKPERRLNKKLWNGEQLG